MKVQLIKDVKIHNRVRVKGSILQVTQEYGAELIRNKEAKIVKS